MLQNIKNKYTNNYFRRKSFHTHERKLFALASQTIKMQYPIQWNEGRQRMRMYLCCKCIYCAHQSRGDTGVVERGARLALCDESCVTGFSPGHIIKLVSVMRSRTHGHLYTQSAEARCSERGLSTVSQPLSATSHWLH